MKRDLTSLTKRKQQKETKEAAATLGTSAKAQTKKLKGFYLTQEAIQQLNVMSAEMGTNASALAAEAFNDLFSKYEKPLVA